MIELFTKRPAMTIMFVLVFVVLGFVSYSNLTIENTPKIKFPMITVKVLYPGAGPLEIETQIIKKIEDVISEISEIKKIESRAHDSFGWIMVEFQLSADINVKAMDIKEKIDKIINNFPSGAKQPIVAKFDPTVTPIVELVLTSQTLDDRDLYEYADKVLKSKFNVLEGVAEVEIYGGKKREINVRLDRTLMQKYYFAIEDVVRAIAQDNINIPGGSITKSGKDISVRMVGEFSNIEKIKEMRVVSREGTEVKLSDIATVEDSFHKVESFARFNGQNAVGLSVKKLSDGDAVKIAAQIQKKTTELKKALPQEMELHVAYDTTTFVVNDTYGTVYNILLGILLTVVILYFFLVDYRVAIIASVVIPTSIISTFFLMDFSQFTINMITLLAIATSLGTLIANSIVIIDSVVAHLEKGKDSLQAAIDGTREVFVAVMASAGTNIVVFTPIAFMGGITGQFMKQFGLTVVYATIFSIFASFTLTPMMCATMLKSKNHGPKWQQRFKHWVDNLMAKVIAEYKIIFDWIVCHPKLTLAVALAFTLLTIYPLRFIGNEFFSKSDMGIIQILIETPQGTSLERTREVVIATENLLQGLPETLNYTSRVGENGPENGKILYRLTDYEKRTRRDYDIMNYLIPELAKIPGASFTLAGGHMGDMVMGDIMISVAGDDYNTMVDLSHKMVTTMDDSGFFKNVTMSHKIPKDEIQFIPNEKKMVEHGVKNFQIGSLLRMAITGDDTNIYREKGEEYKINITLDDMFKSTPDDIAEINVIAKGGLLPLSALGEVKQTKAESPLTRRDKRRVITISGFLAKSTAGQVQRYLDEEFKKISFPEGYNYKYVGMNEMQTDSQNEIKKAFTLAVILTYMLLVALLNSFMQPGTILVSVLFSMITVFYFLFFFDFTINLGSMLAMVMLVGIAVNNSILMIDYAMQKLNEGIELREAIWLGAKERFHAILMTSIAIIAGTFPQLFDPFGVKAAMGAVMVGGMIGSILFPFFVVPIIFIYIERFRAFLGFGSAK